MDELPLFEMTDVPTAAPEDAPTGVASRTSTRKSHAEPVADSVADSIPEWCRRVGVFDVETTGVDVTRDRIVTAHVGLLDETGRVLRSHDWLADPGVPIPASATAVHGVTTAMARAKGRPAAQVVAEIVAALRQMLDADIPVVAYNAAYDLTLLREEALRHGIRPIDSPSPIMDPLILDKAWDTYRRGKRRLTDVAAHYDVRLDDAHAASADAIAAGRVALALARRFPAEVPATAAELHSRQIGWAREQADSLTQYFLKIGRISADEPLDGRWPIR